MIIAVVSAWRSLPAPWDCGRITASVLQLGEGSPQGRGRPDSCKESQARTPGRRLALGTPLAPQATSGDLSPTSGCPGDDRQDYSGEPEKQAVAPGWRLKLEDA